MGKMYFFRPTLLFGAFILMLTFGVQHQLSAQKIKEFRSNGRIFKHKIRVDDPLKNNNCIQNAYRSIDGTCNNTSSPATATWGAADVPLKRAMAEEYGPSDLFNGMAGEDRPSPRAISNAVVAQPGNIPSSYHLSSMVFTWGQFLDHDITLTPESEEESYPIILPDDEPLFTVDIPFHRSAIYPGTGEETPRQQMNLITSWIDGSNVYGSEESRANWLRTFIDGKLKTSSGNLLPFNTIDGEYDSPIDPDAPSMAMDEGGTVKTFVAGDIRAAEQPGLTSLHTLFVREHNRICDELKAQGMTDDEEMYQTARKKVGAYIQSITFNEFLPALGIELPPFIEYDPAIKPDISNIFATAAYRLGHTMVTDEILLRDNYCQPIGNGSLSLVEGFFNPQVVRTYGIEPILKGLSAQVQQEIDRHIIDNLRNFLFADPNGPVVFGLDLASLNIQRGRDHGLPDYNTVRALSGLYPVTSFNQINPSYKVWSTLAKVYQNDVNNIDPWVGMLAEWHMPGKPIGPTLYNLLKEQFQNLRDGDYYYYENDPAISYMDQMQIRNTQLSEIIQRNTSLSYLAFNIFRAKPCVRLGGPNDPVFPGGSLQELESTGDEQEGTLSIFPNPAFEAFTLNIIETDLEELTYVLTTVTGQTVATKQVAHLHGFYNEEIAVDHLPAGIYLLSVNTTNNRYREKVIVK